jgi:hypothetical protein
MRMDKATSSKVAKAMRTIRDVAETASDEERAVMVDMLRQLQLRCEPRAKPAAKALAAATITAAQVVDAARLVLRHGGGFGASKAFICEVYDAIHALNPGLTLDALKASLREMNRRGELSLSRADLVEAMPADVVRRSQMTCDSDASPDELCSTWHFVRV